jgi:hypothetical protein
MLSMMHEALRWWVLHTPLIHQLVLRELAWSADGVHEADVHVVTPHHPQMAVDAAFRLTSNGKPVGMLLYEVQLRKDPAKPFAWLAYVGGAVGTSNLPAALAVLTIDAAVAGWARDYGLPDQVDAPYRFAVAGPDEWGRWAESDPQCDPTLQLVAWLCGQGLDRLPAELSSHLDACARLDMEDRSRYFWLLAAAIRHLPPALAEELMNQTQTRKSFFPMHPAEFAAFDRGVDEGVEKGREEGRKEGEQAAHAALRQTVLCEIQRLAPDTARRLEHEPDVEVLVRALAGLAG